MVQAAAAAQIVHLIGMPEGLFPLSQATIYLANAPKSNAVKKPTPPPPRTPLATAREAVPLHSAQRRHTADEVRRIRAGLPLCP